MKGKEAYALASAVAFLFLACPCGASAGAEDADAIRFVVVGDRTGGAVPGVFEQVLKEVQLLRPDLVFTIGDMIEGDTSDALVLRREWQEYLELASVLTMPLHHTPGNHDISFDKMQTAYEASVGRPYYSFDHRGLHFLVLDNSRWNSIEQFPGSQMAWLEDDLRKGPADRQVLVFMHQPYWYRTLAEGKPDALHALFRRHGVRAVFTGHLHACFSAEYDGILYVGVGSSGGAVPPHRSGMGFGFVWATVDAEGVHIASVKTGAVMPWKHRSVTEFRLTESMQHRALSFAAPAEVGGDLTVAESEVTLRIQNMASEEYGDTVQWEIPEGWTVEPSSRQLTIPAMGVGTATFRVSSTGNLYPTPTVSARLPLSRSETVQVKKPLDVARSIESTPARPRPTIDGDLRDPVWSHPITLLFGPKGQRSDIDPVEVYFANDKENLYVAVRCQENRMDLLAAGMKDRDDEVYREDSFGLNLYPATGGGEGIQIYVNPLGTVFDERIFQESDGFWTSEPEWNGQYEVQTRRGEDFWTAEVRVPLAQLGTKAVRGEAWKLNFRRKQRRLESFAAWQLPWSYNPATCGRLVLH